MTKKRITLIQTMVQLAVAVFWFIPISFIWIKDYSFEVINLDESWYDASCDPSLIWQILVFVVAAICLAYFILYLTTKLSIVRKKYCIAIPCSQFAFWMISFFTIDACSDSYYLTKYGSYYYVTSCYAVEWGFYLISALYLVIIILELVKQFSNIDEEMKVAVPLPAKDSTPETDEFKKLTDLKNLLDQGIITQEEFDAKKKQLLGI